MQALSEDDRQNLMDTIADLNPQALKPDGLEAAIVGYASREFGGPPVLVVSVDLCIEILTKDGEMDEIEAREYLEFNSVGAWMGEGTPLWIYT